MVDWDPRLGDTVSFSLSCSASSIVTESSLSADTSLLQSSTCKDLGTLVGGAFARKHRRQDARGGVRGVVVRLQAR
jgi:hypothetical protein